MPANPNAPPPGEYTCKCGRRLIIERDARGKMITKHELPMCRGYSAMIAEQGRKVRVLSSAEYIPPRKKRR